MKIFLLGIEGYLGNGLRIYLSKYHDVIGWDKKENLFNLTTEYLRREKVDILINLSMVADRKENNYILGSGSDIVNVLGARHVAEVLQGTNISWFQFSTREIFPAIYTSNDVTITENGFRPRLYIDESYPFKPQSLYGKTKLISEYIAESHEFSNVIRLTSPYTDYNHVSGGWVLQLLKAIVTKGTVTLTNGGRQFRDPLHIDDIARFILSAHKNNIFGHKFHLGGGENNIITLREFVLLAQKDTVIIESEGSDLGFAFDSSKAFKYTGWTPEILIRDKIKDIINNINNT
jgi:nucleoside-diphosphate-sugar epimerase